MVPAGDTAAALQAKLREPQDFPVIMGKSHGAKDKIRKSENPALSILLILCCRGSRSGRRCLSPSSTVLTQHKLDGCSRFEFCIILFVAWD